MKFVIVLVFCFATAYCADVQNAPTPAPTDLRNEFDRLLIALTQDKTRQIEEGLIVLNRQLMELQTTKNKDLKAKIITELETGIPLLKGAQAYLEREMKRTDLDIVERFLFEAARDDVVILSKQLTNVETEVNKIVV